MEKNHRLFFEGYTIFRSDRSANKGGGTALLIKKEIKCKCIIMKDLKLIETTIIRMDLENNNKLFIISAYASCSIKEKIQDDLDIIFQKLNLGQKDTQYIIIGDLNARHSLWNDSSNNTRGVQLNKWLQDNSFIYNTKILHSLEPTFKNARSFIDIALLDKSLQTDRDFLALHDYESDHLAISISINSKVNVPTSGEISQPLYLYKKTKWPKFKKKIKNGYTTTISDNSNLSNEEIDEHIDHLETVIRSALQESTPCYKEKCHLEDISNTRKIKTV